MENVLTVIRKCFELDTRNYDIHLNFPGGIPIDGPSAGISMVTAIYSAITAKPVDNKVAMTGEVSIRGKVMPIGGITAKLEAAIQAGVTKVIIPKDNWQEQFSKYSIEIVPVERVEEVIKHAIIDRSEGENKLEASFKDVQLLSASGR